MGVSATPADAHVALGAAKEENWQVLLAELANATSSTDHVAARSTPVAMRIQDPCGPIDHHGAFIFFFDTFEWIASAVRLAVGFVRTGAEPTKLVLAHCAAVVNGQKRFSSRLEEDTHKIWLQPRFFSIGTLHFGFGHLWVVSSITSCASLSSVDLQAVFPWYSSPHFAQTTSQQPSH